MRSQCCYEAAVCMYEVVLVRKKFDMFSAGVGADEDHEVLVSTRRLGGYFAA